MGERGAEAVAAESFKPRSVVGSWSAGETIEATGDAECEMDIVGVGGWWQGDVVIQTHPRAVVFPQQIVDLYRQAP